MAPLWPLALLFVSRQIHDETRYLLYQRTTFAFRFSVSSMRRFATHVTPDLVAHVRDLRLSLTMGSGGDGVNGIDNETIKRFTGLRSLHASLDYRFWKIEQIREAFATEWKRAHWVRPLLNFACHRLQGVPIILDDFGLNRGVPDQEFFRHLANFPKERYREWAKWIEDQILAPWDREAVVLSIQQHQAEEVKYHRKLCGKHFDFKPLASPEQRVPRF